MGEYSFFDQQVMSCGTCESRDVAGIIMEALPGAVSVHAAHQSNDRQGTDYWVEHTRGNHPSVDVKARSEDYAQRGQDDLALETWSVVERNVIGWTRDPNKRTDYVLWVWNDTGRWCLLPFGMLCGVFIDNWQDWINQYKTVRQHTPEHGGYHSECVFVPRKTVWREIYNRYAGVPVT